MPIQNTEIQYNLNGKTRKDLAKVVGRVLGVEPQYLAAPSMAYQIGDYTLTRDCILIYGQEGLISRGYEVYSATIAAGFQPVTPMNIEEEMPEEKTMQTTNAEIDALDISVPLDKVKVGNLTRLLEAKGSLIKKALNVSDLKINVNEDTVSFPWFTDLQAEDAPVYANFISKLCKMSSDAKRVTARAAEVENEKYAFRCFLLRLGFIGKEFKADRKVLLRNLTGSSAFKSGQRRERQDVKTPVAEIQ